MEWWCWVKGGHRWQSLNGIKGPLNVRYCTRCGIRQYNWVIGMLPAVAAVWVIVEQVL